MMRFKRIIALLAITMVTSLVGGCQLAVSEKQETKANGDTLIGCFVTIGNEYHQAIENENKQITVNSLDDIVFEPTKIEGVRNERDGYDFGKLEGYLMYYEQHEEEVDGRMVPVSGSYVDDMIYNVALNINDTDGDVTSNIEGTIGVSRNMNDIVTLHRVYKRADGSVYVAIGGASMHVDGKLGSKASLSIKDKYETKVNGEKTSSNSLELKVSVEPKNEFVGLVIYEMDKNNKILRTKNVDKDFFTDYTVDYKLNDLTEYIIVEESNIDETGNTVINRSIYDYKPINEGDIPIGHFSYLPLKSKVLYPYKINFVK